MPRKYSPDEFWAAFDAKKRAVGECQIWAGRSTLSKGHRRGTVKVNGVYVYAHKVALERKLGRPIAPGKQCNHTCDDTLCVRDEHLYEGTQAQNVKDMHERGRNRQPRGSRNGNAKLTEEQARTVREHPGVPRGWQTQLAREFGVHKNTISAARHHHWIHVTNATA